MVKNIGPDMQTQALKSILSDLDKAYLKKKDFSYLQLLVKPYYKMD